MKKLLEIESPCLTEGLDPVVGLLLGHLQPGLVLQLDLAVGVEEVHRVDLVDLDLGREVLHQRHEVQHVAVARHQALVNLE